MKSRIEFTRLNLAFCVCALVFACQTSGFAQSAQIPTAQIVIFTPSDIKPPPPDKYLPRLHQFGLFAEKFFSDGLTRWGYKPKRKEIFNRSDDGQISVIHVQGDLPAAGDAYKKEWISKQVLGKLKTEHNTKTAGNLFWIFVYIGDPPAVLRARG